MTENEKAFAEHWRLVEERRKSNAENLDRWIMIFSWLGICMILVISSFAANILESDSEGFLGSALIFFGVSITLTLLSYVTSQRALFNSQKNSEKYYIGGNKEYREKKDFWSIATTLLTTMSTITFLIAIFELARFVNI